MVRSRSSPIRNISDRQQTLVIMCKSPVAGNVKTRLARDIGTSHATRLYRSVLFNVVRRLQADRRYRVLVAVAPLQGLRENWWPRDLPDVTCIPQGPGNLGDKMQRVFDLDFVGPVLIIGTDIPEITRQRISDAFRVLRSHDVVLGPADDGGYWCVGLRRSPRIPAIFDNVRWSSPETFADTIKNVQHLRVGLCPPLADIDSIEDYHKLKSTAARVIVSSGT